MRHLVLAAVLVAGLATPASADLEDGEAAFLRGDYAAALRAAMPSAEEGDALAQVLVAGSYFMMGPTRYPEAVVWYQRSAEQGHPEGQLGLAQMYAYGFGTDQKFVHAYMWSSLAERGLRPSRRYRAKEVRKDVVQWMTPDQIAEAQRMVREWLEKHGNE